MNKDKYLHQLFDKDLDEKELQICWDYAEPQEISLQKAYVHACCVITFLEEAELGELEFEAMELRDLIGEHILKLLRTKNPAD